MPRLFIKKNRNLNGGFSIIELLVGIFALVLIGIAAITFQKDVFPMNTFFSNSIAAQGEARKTLKTISAEIRSASPSNVGSYPIEQTTATSFIFYSDTDNDQLKERIRYFLDGPTLKRGVIKPSGIPFVYNPGSEVISELIHDVVNGATAVFNYYDKNYNGTTEPLTEPIDIVAVRLVKITVIIDRDPSKPPGPMTLTTQVSIRNLKDNL